MTNIIYADKNKIIYKRPLLDDISNGWFYVNYNNYPFILRGIFLIKRRRGV